MNFLNYLILAIKTLPAKGRRNGIKILTLSLGLAVGLVLSAKVCFEQTYDDYHTDASRIVYLSENAGSGDENSLYDHTSGGIAPLMKEHYPEVEEATRITFFESGASLIDVETGKRYSVDDVKLADSCYFKIFDRECLAGNITSSLGITNNIVISSSVAEAMASSRTDAYQEVIGKRFTIGSRGTDIVFTVAGVYEKFPANSSFSPDAIISLPSIGRFMYDGTEDVLGNDRYQTYLKLRKGTTSDGLNAKMDSFVEKYLPVEEMRAANFSMSYLAKPLAGLHLESADVVNTILVLGIVAFALLLAAVLNYMLIVISTCVTRGKEMAVRKCLGSDENETAKMMFSEALLHTLLASGLAALFLLAGRSFVEMFLGIELTDLFSGRPLALCFGILLLVVMLNGYVPAKIFNSIPVASAFRNYRENRRAWKRWLLIFEFSLVSFLCVLIGVISAQYDSMVNADLGFSYANSIEIATPESNASQHKLLMNQLCAMPEVADACFAIQPIFPGYDGNNVRLPGHDDDLFNANDLNYVDEHWLNVMGLTLTEGSNFNPDLLADSEVLVDSRFAEKLKATTGWNDVVGRQVDITGHGSNVTIVGVFKTYNQGKFNKEQEELFGRPKMAFYCNPNQDMGKYHYPFQYVRLHSFSADTYQRVLDVINKTLPDQATYVNPFKSTLEASQQDTLETRNAIFVGSFITLLIALLGLIGYTIDEVKRRSKEIAVRRINGALFGQIRLMFQQETLRITIPSAIVGCVIGCIVALNWEENFTVQAGLPWWVPTAAILFTIGIVALISDLFVYRIANSNPAESIKTE